VGIQHLSWMSKKSLVKEASMRNDHLVRPGAWIVAAAIVSGSALGVRALQQSAPEGPALRQSLPRATALPSTFRRVAELASRGVFYAAGTPFYRIDDGNSHHGFAALPLWATAVAKSGTNAHGIVYGVEDGLITSAGYLIRQADLVASKSFHGLTLREFNFPPARYVTVDFVKGATPEANQYLWLWHFLPQQGRVRPMLRAGELQSVKSLPPTYAVYACEDSPNNFCPRMGRHHRDPAASASRRPTATGDGGVLYGEAAGKLIFIEYILSQQDLAAGASWPAMPLDGLAIPPIDNVHILHFTGAEGAPGRYTVHMYFIPEETYLAWEKEPAGL
jgi:hypothetical protein